MATKRKNVPEHLRRAIRLSISVGIAAATGFSLLSPLGGWHSRWGSQTMMGTKWAAITSVVCNAPVIAKTTEVALERVLGTVTGGMLGYGLAITNDKLPFLDQPFFTVIAATVVAFSSIILGYKLRLDYAGRLFIMTFILVVMAAPRKEDAFVVAVTRISGIIFGVITTMIMSVVVFPKSASHQATDNLQAGLAALARLNAVAWRRGDAGCTAARDVARPPYGCDTCSGEHARRDSEAEAVRVTVEDEEASDLGVDDCCDEALSDVYAKMSTCQEFTALSKSETYVFTSRGRWCLIPAFKCLPWRSALPAAEMSAVVSASRKVARLLWCLHTSLPEGGDIVVLDKHPGALEYLAHLGRDLQVYFEALASAFPNQRSLEVEQLYSFVEGVETLIAASRRASRDSTILLEPRWTPHRYRTSAGAAKQASELANGFGSHGHEPDPGSRQRNVAFICEMDGLVTQVGGPPKRPGSGSPQAIPETGSLQCNGSAAPFSPSLETMNSGSQKDAVLRAATLESETRSEASTAHDAASDNKNEYISQVRWQATQFLLRRLSQELAALNSAFIRLSVLLPPTRWESRRRRWQQQADVDQDSVTSPLLRNS